MYYSVRDCTDFIFHNDDNLSEFRFSDDDDKVNDDDEGNDNYVVNGLDDKGNGTAAGDVDDIGSSGEVYETMMKVKVTTIK